MRRATKLEAQTALAPLRSWHPTATFRACLTEVKRPFGFYAVSQGVLQPWREAMSALYIGEATNASHIRLGNNPPDFHLRIDGEDLSFELTDALEEGRTRGVEFDTLAEKANRGEKLQPLLYDVDAEVLSVAAMVGERIKSKARKTYPKGTILAIHAHAAIYGMTSLLQKFDEIVLSDLKGISHAFPEVWVYRNESLLRVTATESLSD